MKQFLSIALLWIAVWPATAETIGLATKYPRDAGIARDPAVLFAEDFETGSLDETGKRWSDVSNKNGNVLAFSDDVPVADAGKRSLQMTATLGENTGGHLYKQLGRGVDKAFARFYVKFAKDVPYIHHFVHLGGYNPPTRWPQGGAGERPRGDERVTVGIEPHGVWGKFPAPGAWQFYAYWQDMKKSGDGKYWGNIFAPEPPALVPRDRWQCVEIMLQLNSTPDKSDGALALWLDGKLAWQVAEGFRWRKNTDLKVNFFWLLHYVTENAARQNKVAQPNPVNRVWFDDVVVATEYIGPIKQ